MMTKYLNKFLIKMIEHYVPEGVDSYTNVNSRAFLYDLIIELIEDVYRILKPHGLFLHVTLAYPSEFAFQEPTHVNIITETHSQNIFVLIKK